MRMIKKIIIGIIVMGAIMPIFAEVKNSDRRYQRAQIVVKNNTFFPVTFTIVITKGAWEYPAPKNNVPILLNPQEEYRNTIISTEKQGIFNSFVSMCVAQIGHSRENYIIFAQDTDSGDHSITEHIFDGLGNMFVDSATNHCDQNTEAGYADCHLVVNA